MEVLLGSSCIVTSWFRVVSRVWRVSREDGYDSAVVSTHLAD
jgi:hypothetical protein